jgi:hypothetical protein
MDVKEVVRIAVEYVADVFSADEPTNLGLEEVIFDDSNDCWNVTVGFSRPWDYEKRTVLSDLTSSGGPKRHYKIVQVSNQDGKVNAIRIRG